MFSLQTDRRGAEDATSGPKTGVQKSWFQENAASRYTPFSVVPRTVKSFSTSDDEEDEDEEEYDESDKREDEDSDLENFVGTGSELLVIDSEEDKEGRRKKDKKRTKNLNEKLDSQVKQLLNGLSSTTNGNTGNAHGPRYDDNNSNEFGAQRFKSFNSRSRTLDENAPPLMTLEDQYEQIMRDSGNSKLTRGVEKSHKTNSDGTNNNSNNSRSWVQDLDKSVKYVNPDSFNAFNSNFFNNFSKNPVSRGNTISELTGINENNLNDDSKNSFFDTYSTLARRTKGDVIKTLMKPASSDSISGISNDLAKNNRQQKEYAILVYGYAEEDANLIIEHFNKFGKILENFEINNNIKMFNLNNKSKSLPICVGESWIKLTYDNETSFFRALNEDSVLFKEKYYLQVIEFNSKSLFEIKNVARNIKYANIFSSDDNDVTTDEKAHDVGIGNKEQDINNKNVGGTMDSLGNNHKSIEQTMNKDRHSMFSTSFNLFNASNVNKVKQSLSTHNSVNGLINKNDSNSSRLNGVKSDHRLNIIKDKKKILKAKDKKRLKIKDRKIDNPLAKVMKNNSPPVAANTFDYNLNLIHRLLDWAFGIESL